MRKEGTYRYTVTAITVCPEYVSPTSEDIKPHIITIYHHPNDACIWFKQEFFQDKETMVMGSATSFLLTGGKTCI